MHGRSTYLCFGYRSRIPRLIEIYLTASFSIIIFDELEENRVRVQK
jgi:hypothetical protein